MKTELPSAPCFLGIECGGSRTIALLARNLSQMNRVEAGPANLKLLSDADLVRHFRLLSGYFSKPDAVGVGMAGARTGADRERILKAAAQVWPKIPCSASHDLEIALLAAELQEQQQKENGNGLLQGDSRNGDLLRTLQLPAGARVLVLSGTGSCCYGRIRAGRSAQVDGWGHILGDKGSGYDIGLRALKTVVYYYDRQRVWSPLGQRILRVLQLNEPNDLIGWSQQATKTDVAALAIEVFQAGAKRDKIASDILGEAARSLAEDAAACARRLTRRGARVQFVLAGSILLRQRRFAEQVINQLHGLWPEGVVTALAGESVWGAVELARRHYESLRRVAAGAALDGAQTLAETFSTAPARASRLNSALTKNFTLPESSRLSPTEQRNPRSRNLDKLPLSRMISLMLSEDAKIPGAILVERKQIERGIRLVERAFRNGGRLFYVGAGTSGRLGVLDASECPPTFRTPPEQVQGIIAGGQRALWQSVEGAEDDPRSGASSVEGRGVARRDVVVGIAASGRTPFVWGALDEAKRRGATTILICFNPFLKIPRALQPSLVIAPNVGPEVLTGSTRLKAGTATKLILNLFTTLTMVRLGKVAGNLMVDLNPSNRKLRDRAIRITTELSGADSTEATRALEKSKWVVKTAIGRLLRRKR